MNVENGSLWINTVGLPCYPAWNGDREVDVAVIGGGDVAVEDAIFLSRMCSKVYLIHRRGKLRAAKSLQNQLFSKGNVEILWNTEAEAIKGDGAVESLLLQEQFKGEK